MRRIRRRNWFTRRRERKKGITPIIAVILLLMMTVAAAGAAFFWFIRIQGELQGGAESFSGTLSERISSKVEMIVADYSDTNQVDIFLKNNGNSIVTIEKGSSNPTTTWILQDSEQKVVCSEFFGTSSSDDVFCQSGCDDELEVGELQKVRLALSNSGDCDISSNTDYPIGTVFSFIIDFGGQSGTGGQFVKEDTSD